MITIDLNTLNEQSFISTLHFNQSNSSHQLDKHKYRKILKKNERRRHISNKQLLQIN